MKNKKYFLLLSLVVFSGCFFIFSGKARADVNNFKAYALSTSDTTPTIRGSIDAADVGTTTVTVQVEGGAVKNVTTFDADGNWSYTLTDVLAVGNYDYEAIATKGGSTVTINWTHGLQIDSDQDFDIYWWGTNSQTVQFVEFPRGYLYSAEGFEVSFDENSRITRSGGGTFDASEWYIESASDSNDKIIKKLRFGVPNTTLSFSNPVTIIFNVGTGYNGETLNVFSRSDGGDDGWERETTCVVSSGQCSFNVSHASYFAISEAGSLAEDDDEEKAHANSWKAYRYEDANKSCPSRLKLIVKGKHFDKDAEVKIGSHEASSVSKKSSKELVAKFCYTKLLENKADHKRKIYITNPDADTEEADKEIDLDDIAFGDGEGADYYNSETSEGIKNIQEKLSQLKLLDFQYVTGIYGPITTEAVKKFQQQNGLPETGFVGPLTKTKL